MALTVNGLPPFGLAAAMTACGAPSRAVSASLARACTLAASKVTTGNLPMARSRLRAHVTFNDFTPAGSTRRDKPGTLASWRRWAVGFGRAEIGRESGREGVGQYV